jgi:hypothetical protein
VPTTLARRRRGRERMSDLAQERDGRVTARDATVEGSQRSSRRCASVCVARAMSCAWSLALRYLRARRFRGRQRMAMPGAGESPGGFHPSPSFFRATRPSGGRREPSWRWPAPPWIRPQPGRRDSRSPITSRGCSTSTPAAARRRPARSRFAWTMRRPAARRLDARSPPVRSSVPRPATGSSPRRSRSASLCAL